MIKLDFAAYVVLMKILKGHIFVAFGLKLMIEKILKSFTSFILFLKILISMVYPLPKLSFSVVLSVFELTTINTPS